MPDEFEARVVSQVGDVHLRSREEVVNAHNLITVSEEPVDQVRSEEPCCACDQS